MSGESVVSSAVPAAATRTTSFKGSSPSSKYVKLNVGGALYYTTMQTLTKQDTMLKAMFSGRMEVLTDSEGKDWGVPGVLHVLPGQGKSQGSGELLFVRLEGWRISPGLGLFSLDKRQAWGDLIVVFQCLKEPQEPQRRNIYKALEWQDKRIGLD